MYVICNHTVELLRRLRDGESEKTMSHSGLLKASPSLLHYVSGAAQWFVTTNQGETENWYSVAEDRRASKNCAASWTGQSGGRRSQHRMKHHWTRSGGWGGVGSQLIDGWSMLTAFTLVKLRSRFSPSFCISVRVLLYTEVKGEYGDLHDEIRAVNEGFEWMVDRYGPESLKIGDGDYHQHVETMSQH